MCFPYWKGCGTFCVLQSVFASYIWAELIWVVPFCAMVSMVTCQHWPGVYKMPWCVTQSMESIKNMYLSVAEQFCSIKYTSYSVTEIFSLTFCKEGEAECHFQTWTPQNSAMNDWSLSGLWCEDICSGADGKSAVSIDQSSKMFGLCCSVPHCFMKSCGCVSFHYHFLLFVVGFCFFPKLEGKWQNATNHGNLIFCIPFYCILVS